MIATRFPTNTSVRGVAELAETAKRIEALLTDAVGLLSTIAGRTEVPRLPTESKCVRAIRLLAGLGPDNLSEIARIVGVHRRTLNKWPVFMEAVDRMRAAEQWRPREPRAVRGSLDGELV